MRKRLYGSRRALMAVTVGMTVAASFVLPAGPATAAPHVGSPVHYVALGDSRAVGPSWLSFVGGDGCGRTPTGYPTLVAAAIRPASFTDVACSGATSATILTTPQTAYNPLPHRVPVQIGALRADTTLVTISIGGNDIDWTSLIAPCFGTVPGADTRCRTNVPLAHHITDELTRLRPAVDGVLRAVHARSPRATIVVVGHGGYYGDRGCFPSANVHGADARFVGDFFARFNGVLRSSATANGARFVDIAGPAVGHDACAPAATRWFTGAFTPGPTPFFHPTPAGSAAMSRLVLAAIGA